MKATLRNLAVAFVLTLASAFTGCGKNPPASKASVICSGVLTNLEKDDNNCGECGRICSNGMTCQNGDCLLCPSGTWNCAGNCVDIKTDNNNCGGCNVKCDPGKSCQPASSPVNFACQ